MEEAKDSHSAPFEVLKDRKRLLVSTSYLLKVKQLKRISVQERGRVAFPSLPTEDSSS